jgi:hypothetical protein
MNKFFLAKKNGPKKSDMLRLQLPEQDPNPNIICATWPRPIQASTWSFVLFTACSLTLTVKLVKTEYIYITFPMIVNCCPMYPQNKSI